MPVDAGTIYSEVRLEIDKLRGDIKKMNTEFDKFGKVNKQEAAKVQKSWTDKFKQINLAGVAAMAGIGIAVKKAITVFADFEQSMANVQSVARATPEEFQKLEEAALSAGETTAFSASEAADALYALASAGLDATEATAALDGVLTLAGATGSDLATTAADVTAAVSQFSLEASDSTRVANVYAAAIANSQANMDKLSSAMRQVGPVAGALGISLEETTGALQVLFDAGFKGEQAGTALRNALSSLANQTDPTVKKLEELGLAYEDLNPETNALADIIGVLSEAGLEAGEVINAFGREAGPQLLTLLDAGREGLKEYTDAVTGTDAAAEAYGIQMDTVKGAVAELRSAVESGAISFVKEFEPAIRSVLNVLTGFIRLIGKLPGGVKIFLGVLAGGIPVVAGLTKVVTGLGAAFSGMLGPISLAVAGVAGAITVISALAGRADAAERAQNRLRDKTDQLVESVDEYKTITEQLETAIANGNIAEAETLKLRQELLKTQIAANLQETVSAYEKLGKAEEKEVSRLEKLQAEYNRITGEAAKYEEIVREQIMSGNANSETVRVYQGYLKQLKGPIQDATTALNEQKLTLQEIQETRRNSIDILAQQLNAGNIELSQIRLYNDALAEKVLARAEDLKAAEDEVDATEKETQAEKDAAEERKRLEEERKRAEEEKARERKRLEEERRIAEEEAIAAEKKRLDESVESRQEWYEKQRGIIDQLTETEREALRQAKEASNREEKEKAQFRLEEQKKAQDAYNKAVEDAYKKLRGLDGELTEEQIENLRQAGEAQDRELERRAKEKEQQEKDTLAQSVAITKDEYEGKRDIAVQYTNEDLERIRQAREERERLSKEEDSSRLEAKREFFRELERIRADDLEKEKLKLQDEFDSYRETARQLIEDEGELSQVLLGIDEEEKERLVKIEQRYRDEQERLRQEELQKEKASLAQKVAEAKDFYNDIRGFAKENSKQTGESVDESTASAEAAVLQIVSTSIAQLRAGSATTEELIRNLAQTTADVLSKIHDPTAQIIGAIIGIGVAIADVISDVINFGEEFDAALDKIEDREKTQLLENTKDRLDQEYALEMENLDKIYEDRMEKANEAFNAELDAYIATLSEKEQLALRSAGYIEETEKERIERLRDEAIEAGDTEKAALLENALEIAKIKEDAALEQARIEKEIADQRKNAEDEYRKAVAQYEYDYAVFQKELAVEQAKIELEKAKSELPWYASKEKHNELEATYADLISAIQAAPLPTIPSYQTGGIVVPSGGQGTQVTVAENGSPELLLNSGAEGMAFMDQFAGRIAQSIGKSSAGGTMQIVIQLDGKVLSQSTVDYINNGKVRLKA